MADRDMIACDQAHEMESVLRYFGKSRSKDNIAKMQDICKAFKKDASVKPHNRSSFYEYLEKKKMLSGLSSPK